MSEAPLSVRRVLIRGLVQGVGYRAWLEREAVRRGVQGWVRNRRDGAVEALFAAPAETVAAMLTACRDGPRGARVDAIEELQAGDRSLGQRRPGELFSVLATV